MLLDCGALASISSKQHWKGSGKKARQERLEMKGIHVPMWREGSRERNKDEG